MTTLEQWLEAHDEYIRQYNSLPKDDRPKVTFFHPAFMEAMRNTSKRLQEIEKRIAAWELSMIDSEPKGEADYHG